MAPSVCRRLVPDDYPLVGVVPINRPICDFDEPVDPHLGALPPPPNIRQLEDYGPTIWDENAYLKSFEKFYYAEPVDFFRDYPELCAFADLAFKKHFSFLQDTRVVHITATEKNLDSCPAYPKLCWYSSEREFLEEQMWAPYIKEFARIDKKVKDGKGPRVLWYCFLKKEVLKAQKIKDGDIRQILCADPIYSRIGACFEQHQNQLMKEMTDVSSGQCGWTPFEGGFKAVCERLQEKKGVFIEFDWTRFDGTIPTPLFLHIKKLRWSFINEQQRERYGRMYRWYCRNLVDRYVVMPSGEVTRQKRGNPSGQISTTMDNNMVNYWLQAFEWAWFNGPDFEKFGEFETVIYGDDRLSAWSRVPDDFSTLASDMYRRVFGMWVKPEKVKVSPQLEGLSFCGFTIGPGFNPRPAEPFKLMASLLKPSKKLPDYLALHGKLLCYQILMHFVEDEHPFKRYVLRCLDVTWRLSGKKLLRRFTEQQLNALWWGGPKKCDGR